MSDLAEIAAAAGITIIDSELDEGGDVKNSHEESLLAGSGDYLLADPVKEWDAMFFQRYTDADEEYVHTLDIADSITKPPCVDSFNCRRHRNDSRNWNRDRDNHSYNRYDGGDRGNSRDRGMYGRDRSRHGDGHGGWDRGDNRSYDCPRDNGDYNSRGYGDHRQRGYGDSQNRGYGDQQNRGYGYDDHRFRGRGRGENRDRSSQR